MSAQCSAYPAVDFIKSLTTTGTMTINGFPLSTPAWSTVNLMELWTLGEVRGSDLAVPGLPGLRAYPRRLTETTYSLPMVFTGDVDQAEVPWTDWMAGLEANVVLFSNSVMTQPVTVDGTKTAVLTRPSGAQQAGPIHVLRLTPGAVEGVARYTLTIDIPAGTLVSI